MFKFMILPVAAAAFLLTGASNTSAPAPASGSFQIDTRHSDAQLITDGMTDFGNKKVTFTLGFARVNGTLNLDTDPAKSIFEFRLYPATSMTSPIGENGKIKAEWLANVANHTLVCFHSKKVVRTADNKLAATGDLVVTRVDRNIEVTPSEAYAGPVYGPPIVHRVAREATFVFDIPAPGQKELRLSGSTSAARETFPELVRTVVGTYWPPLVQDANCQNTSGGSEDYRGEQCTGTLMMAPGLPAAPTHVGEDFPGAANFNAVAGNQLTILVHLRVTSSVASNTATRTGLGE